MTGEPAFGERHFVASRGTERDRSRRTIRPSEREQAIGFRDRHRRAFDRPDVRLRDTAHEPRIDPAIADARIDRLELRSRESKDGAGRDSIDIARLDDPPLGFLRSGWGGCGW